MTAKLRLEERQDAPIDANVSTQWHCAAKEQPWSLPYCFPVLDFGWAKQVGQHWRSYQLLLGLSGPW
jgi:hypothetical protein